MDAYIEMKLNRENFNKGLSLYSQPMDIFDDADWDNHAEGYPINLYPREPILSQTRLFKIVIARLVRGE